MSVSPAIPPQGRTPRSVHCWVFFRLHPKQDGVETLHTHPAMAVSRKGAWANILYKDFCSILPAIFPKQAPTQSSEHVAKIIRTPATHIYIYIYIYIYIEGIQGPTLDEVLGFLEELRFPPVDLDGLAT
jgi:hypothetical protein